MPSFGFFQGSSSLFLIHQLEHGDLGQLRGVSDLQFDILTKAIAVVVANHFIIEEIVLVDFDFEGFIGTSVPYSLIKLQLKVSYSTLIAVERKSDKPHPILSAPWHPPSFRRCHSESCLPPFAHFRELRVLQLFTPGVFPSWILA